MKRAKGGRKKNIGDKIELQFDDNSADGREEN